MKEGRDCEFESPTNKTNNLQLTNKKIYLSERKNI